MPNYLQLPNGAYYEAPDDMTHGQALRAAYKEFPEAFGGTPNAPAEKPKSGLMGAFGSGLESLLSTSRTGLGAAFGNANEAAKAGLERQEEIDKAAKEINTKTSTAIIPSKEWKKNEGYWGDQESDQESNQEED